MNVKRKSFLEEQVHHHCKRPKTLHKEWLYACGPYGLFLFSEKKWCNFVSDFLVQNKIQIIPTRLSSTIFYTQEITEIGNINHNTIKKCPISIAHSKRITCHQQQCTSLNENDVIHYSVPLNNPDIRLYFHLILLFRSTAFCFTFLILWEPKSHKNWYFSCLNLIPKYIPMKPFFFLSTAIYLWIAKNVNCSNQRSQIKYHPEVFIFIAINKFAIFCSITWVFMPSINIASQHLISLTFHIT